MWKEQYERKLVPRDVLFIRLAEQWTGLPLDAALEQLTGIAATLDPKALRELWSILTLYRKSAGRRCIRAATELDERVSIEPVESDAGLATQIGAVARGLQDTMMWRRRISTYDVLIKRLVELLAERGESTAPTDIASVTKLNSYLATMKRLNELAVTSDQGAPGCDFFDRIGGVRRGIEQLLTVEPVEYLARDLHEVIGLIWESEGDLRFGALDDAGAVGRCYYSAVTVYEATGLSEAADSCRLKAINLLLGSKADYDRTLDQLNALLSRSAGSPASIGHAEAQFQLVKTYAAVGSVFEASAAVAAVERELTELGYRPPEEGLLPEVSLEGWIAVADAAGKTPEAFEEALLRVATLYAGIASVRARLAQDVQVAARQEQLSTDLCLLTQEMIERSKQAFLANSRKREAFAVEVGAEGEAYSPIGEPQVEKKLPAALADFYALVDLSRRLGDLRVGIGRLSGDRSALEQLRTEAEAIETESRQRDFWTVTATALILQADVLIAAEDYAGAIDQARAALALPRDEGRGLTTGLYALERMVSAYMGLQDDRGVSATCGEAIELIERHRYSVSAPYLQSAYLTQRIRFYGLGVASALRLKDNALAVERAELSKARATLRQLGDLPSDLSLEELRGRFRDVCREIDEVRGSVHNGEALESLLAKRRTLWDLLMICRTRAKADRDLSAFSLDAVQATLDEDEAVIYYYWLAPTVLLIVGLDRYTVAIEKIVMEDHHREALEKYATFTQSLKQGAFTYLNRVRQFSTALLPESLTPLLDGKRRLIISPHRLLHALPLHALTWEGEPLICRFAVSYTPNLSALLWTYDSSSSGRSVAVGIKDFDVPAQRLQPIDGAEREVEAIKRIYADRGVSVDVVKSVEATKSRLLRIFGDAASGGYRWIHIATHGEDVGSDTPMESFLYLRDARLDGLEIGDWQLNAELVVLSACHSGQRAISGRGLAELPGDEIFGLQGALFLAGARRVLGALWPAHDGSATKIMVDFHRHLVEGEVPEIALQGAMLDHLNGADAETRNLYYWAPFFLAAVGRTVRSISDLPAET